MNCSISHRSKTSDIWRDRQAARQATCSYPCTHHTPRQRPPMAVTTATATTEAGRRLRDMLQVLEKVRTLARKRGRRRRPISGGGWSRGGVGGNLREGRGPRTLPHTQPHRPHPHFPRLHHQRAPRLRPNLVPKSCKPFLDLAAMCSTETQRQAVQRVLAQQRRKAVRADWVLKTDLSGSI